MPVLSEWHYASLLAGADESVHWCLSAVCPFRPNTPDPLFRVTQLRVTDERIDSEEKVAVLKAQASETPGKDLCKVNCCGCRKLERYRRNCKFKQSRKAGGGGDPTDKTCVLMTHVANALAVDAVDEGVVTGKRTDWDCDSRANQHIVNDAEAVFDMPPMQQTVTTMSWSGRVDARTGLDGSGVLGSALQRAASHQDVGAEAKHRSNSFAWLAPR
jgi:hypothetical protein